jgi:hydroxyacylglutathione hydrolase
MLFQHFLTSVNEANAFIVGCEETRQAMLIDAGAFEPEMRDFLKQHQLRLAVIFITHDHYDHTDGLEAAMQLDGAQVYCAKGNGIGVPAEKVGHGDMVRVGALEGRVVSTPGHTPDGLSLVFPAMAFTGDALFAGSVGGTGSSRDAALQLSSVRDHIFSLPPATELHVGHGPSTTVAIESSANPFFV